MADLPRQEALITQDAARPDVQKNATAGDKPDPVEILSLASNAVGAHVRGDAGRFS